MSVRDENRIQVVKPPSVLLQDVRTLTLRFEATVDDDLRVLGPNLQTVALTAGAKALKVETHMGLVHPLGIPNELRGYKVSNGLVTSESDRVGPRAYTYSFSAKCAEHRHAHAVTCAFLRGIIMMLLAWTWRKGKKGE